MLITVLLLILLHARRLGFLETPCERKVIIKIESDSVKLPKDCKNLNKTCAKVGPQGTRLGEKSARIKGSGEAEESLDRGKKASRFVHIGPRSLACRQG